MGEAAEEEEEEDSGLNSSEDSDEVEVEAQPRLPGFRGPCADFSLGVFGQRHLGMDPEYREYKKKTPWVLFPGVY